MVHKSSIKVDSNGDYYIKIQDELMSSLDWVLGDEVDVVEDKFWSESKMDYRSKIVINKSED